MAKININLHQENSTQNDICIYSSIIDETRTKINRASHKTPFEIMSDIKVNFEAIEGLKINISDIEKIGDLSESELSKYIVLVLKIPDFKLPNTSKINLRRFIDDLHCIVINISNGYGISKNHKNPLIQKLYKESGYKHMWEYAKSIVDIDLFYMTYYDMLYKEMDETTNSRADRGDIPKKLLDKLGSKESFNPTSHLKDILKLPSSEKKKSLNAWKQSYKFQLETMIDISRVIKNLTEKLDITIFQSKNPINKYKSRNLGIKLKLDIIHLIKLKLETLSIEQREQVLFSLNIYIDKLIHTEKLKPHLKYDYFRRSFIAKTQNIPREDIRGDIDITYRGANIVFHIYDRDCFKSMSGDENIDGISTGGYSYDEIISSLAIINMGRINPNRQSETEDHEIRHLENKILFGKTHLSELDIAKDEIIAYLSTNTNINTIRQKMIISDNPMSYNYFDHLYSKLDLDEYTTIINLHNQDIEKSLNIVEKLANNIPNYIDLLSIVPIRKWYLLEKLYLDK